MAGPSSGVRRLQQAKLQAKRTKRRPSKTKARKILKDKTIRGKKITPKQRRFFGAIAGGAKKKK